MTYKLDNGDKTFEARIITICLNDVDFRFQVNKFNELVVTKSDSSIVIIPQVSNQMIIK